MKKKEMSKQRFRVLPTGDPQSLFRDNLEPKEILRRLGMPRSMLSRSAKTDKSARLGFKTAVMYLSSGVLCARASESCRRSCLGHASGRMMMPTHSLARDRRTALFLEDREHFKQLLRRDLQQHCWEAKTEGLVPAFRLNGSSDIPYEVLWPDLLAEFADERAVFYDYTKYSSRVLAFLDPKKPFSSNYHLTFSAHENNAGDAQRVLDAGGTVAVVFWPSLPETFMGVKVVDGDADDCRFLDPAGTVIGLRAKGIAKEELSGFVIRTDRAREKAELATN